MAKKSRPKPTAASPSFVSFPELICISEPSAALRASRSEVVSASGANTKSLNALLKAAGASMTPIFGSEQRVASSPFAAAAARHASLPDLNNFYSVSVAPEKMERLAVELRKDPRVQAAYVKPPASPPVWLEAAAETRAARGEEAPTANFVARQLYLEAAPGGIDARFAWTRTGGKGVGVRIVDIEGAWRFTHEDLLQNQGGVIAGTPSPDSGWRNHGTAVVGVFGGDENGFGVTGIAPQANTRAISIFGLGSATAIRQAADALNAGDIILIELHAPGPGANGTGQDGYIAMEWWPDNFAAIAYATARGVIVVEAAGNGSRSLDAPIYNAPSPGFPPNWRNPFNLSNPQSGAILVGAGAPPPGTHGNDHGPDRSRLGFSNYGARLDVQGWGREVTTAGYGDSQGGANEDLWYTDVFSGTSSASPIVVGAMACMQGALRGANRSLLTPATARNILRTTGSPQTDAPTRPATQRIGNRPNLRQALQQLLPGAKPQKETKTEKREGKEFKEVKVEKNEKLERKELKEHVKLEKNEKVERKEFKEFKEKEMKEKPEKELFEKPRDSFPGGAEHGFDVNDRLGQLEASVAALSHFIGAELRPDLGSSALTHEDDLHRIADEVSVQAEEAKASKDIRDVR